jgi:hypothetical protein
MNLDKEAYVEMGGGYLYVYLDRGWPPSMPSIVRACHRRVQQLFDFFREHGLGRPADGVVEIPASCVAAATALAITLYASDLNRDLAYWLCVDPPDTVRALVADAVRWSRANEGPTIEPRYYQKLAALKEIVELWWESRGRI